MSEGHSILAPSAAHRWMHCPGSLVLHTDTSSEAAEEGTTAHALASFCLDTNLDAQQGLERLRLNTKVKDFELTAAEEALRYADVDLNLVDDAMVGYVQGYLDFVRARIGEDDQLYVEHRVHFSVPLGLEAFENAPQGGTSDAIILGPTKITIIDFKYGSSPNGIVAAEQNPQLLLYTLGALHEFEPLGDFTEFDCIIYQPRVDHIDVWSCTLDEVDAFSDSVRRAARTGLALKLDAEQTPPNALALFEAGHLKATPKGCRWCSVKAVCPAYAQTVADITDADFTDYSQGVTDPAQIKDLELVPPTDLERLEQAMNHVAMVEHWCKAVRAETERRLLAGDEFQHWKLVQGKKGNREWQDEDAAEALLKKFRLKQEQIYTMKVISPTKAEKILAEKPRQWKQAEALIVQTQGGLSVAPMSDKRPAVLPEALKAQDDDFDDYSTDAVLDDLM